MDVIREFILNEVTEKNADREHLRKLSPQMLGQLDKAIQSELVHPINPHAVGETE